MRTDSDFVMQELLARLKRYPTLQATKARLYKVYDSFTQTLTTCLLNYFRHKGTVRIDVYEAADLEDQLRQKVGSSPIVSLDPLVSRQTNQFGMSRIYYPGGVSLYKQMNRPGTLNLADQAAAISAIVRDTPVCVVDDDTCSGGSLVSAVQMLNNAKVRVKKASVGIQLGEAVQLATSGIQSDPCVRYTLANPTRDIYTVTDLGDPRDFLVGVCGLAVLLPGGYQGRAPYVLPFVSPAARAQIVPEDEQAFSMDILHASRDFYQAFYRESGVQIELRDVDPFFCSMLVRNYDAQASTPMTAIIDDVMKRLPEIWSHTQSLSSLGK